MALRVGCAVVRMVNSEQANAAAAGKVVEKSMLMLVDDENTGRTREARAIARAGATF